MLEKKAFWSKNQVLMLEKIPNLISYGTNTKDPEQEEKEQRSN